MRQSLYNAGPYKPAMIGISRAPAATTATGEKVLRKTVKDDRD
jgi:hypothetical protein